MIDWTDEFDRWLNTIDERADGGDLAAGTVRGLVEAELEYLENLDGAPLIDTPTLKAVRQSAQTPVWRLSHPFVPGFAVRLIVWFDGDVAVVVLFGTDKAQMGDVFYDPVGMRADIAVRRFLTQRKKKG